MLSGIEIFKFFVSDHLKRSDVTAINNVSACSVLFLSMTELFPARRKILEHEA